MLEEASVLDRQHRLHHDWRNVVVLDHLPLRALFRVEEGCDQLRLEFIGREFIPLAGDPRNLTVLNLNARGLRRVIGFVPRIDIYPALHQLKTSQLRRAFLLRVAGAPQFRG